MEQTQEKEMVSITDTNEKLTSFYEVIKERLKLIKTSVINDEVSTIKSIMYKTELGDYYTVFLRGDNPIIILHNTQYTAFKHAINKRFGEY